MWRNEAPLRSPEWQIITSARDHREMKMARNTATLLALLALSSSQVLAQTWTPPRTPWGDPDLQGNFTNKYEQGTPFERPDEFAGRKIDDLKNEELKDMVLESIEEHKQVKTLLREMDSLSKDSEKFEPKLKVLKENVEHHAEEEEEGKMFPKVRKLFSASELQELGAELEAAKGNRERKAG